jgi:stress-induced morphogen
MVNAALADEFKCGLHALSLATETPEEFPKDA